MTDSPLRHLLRLVATGVGMLVFALGCALVLLLALPMLALPVAKARRVSLMRRTIAGLFALYTRVLALLGLMTLDVRGLRAMPAGTVIVANHPSLIDAVIMLSLVPEATCVAKGALFRNPLTAVPVRCADHINSDSPEFLAQSVAALATSPLLIFAEGTRSTPGEPLRFQRGAAHIALQAQAEIVPVSVTLEPVSLIKGQAWWQIPPSTPRYLMVMHEALPVAPYLAISDERSLQARSLNRDLEARVRTALGAQRELHTDSEGDLDYNSNQG